MTPADQAHGLIAIQLLIAFLQVDMQVLSGGRIVIIHVKGYIKVHAAQGVHHLAHSLPLDHHIEVRGDTGKLSYLFFQGSDTFFHLGIGIRALIVVIHRIEPVSAALSIHIDHGIAGQAHAVDGLIHRIKGDEHHGVGIAAAGGILTHQQEGVYPFLSAALGHIGQLRSVIGRAVPVSAIRHHRDIRQLHPGLEAHSHCYDNDRNHRQHLKQSVPDLLSAVQPSHPGLMPRPPTVPSGGTSSSCCTFSLSAHTFLIS